MIDIAISAAKQAGDLLRQAYNQSGFTHYTYKDASQIVSEVDVASEKCILGILQALFPDHSYFSEESGLTRQESAYYWVIDPLDGTTNFTRKLPHFNVSIALLKDNKPALAVVYHPLIDELYAAEFGKGAFLNGSKIRLSDVEEMSKSVVSIGRGASPEARKVAAKSFELLAPNVRSIRDFGATALDLSYLAAGKFDAHVNNSCNLYDCAAGNLIAIEAGACLTDFAGQPFDWNKEVSDILVTTPQLQKQYLDILAFVGG